MSQVGDVKTPPPPPPPPSHLDLAIPELKLSPKLLNSSEVREVNENELELTVKRFLSHEMKLNDVFYLTNTTLKPQLQDGPKCGLVALSIATSQAENFTNVEDIFEQAVSLGMTRQGEMFCTNSLALLAEKYNFKTQVISGGLSSHLNCIIKSLLRKCLLLVPYDADFNHAPCCKKGLKAHWTVITGFVIFIKGDSGSDMESGNFILLNSSKNPSLCKCISNNDCNLPLTISHYQEKILIGKSSLKESLCNLREGKIYLIGLQGKSRHIGLWSFEEMCESNNNLISFPTSGDNNYIIPEGGIEMGLKDKYFAIVKRWADRPVKFL